MRLSFWWEKAYSILFLEVVLNFAEGTSTKSTKKKIWSIFSTLASL